MDQMLHQLITLRDLLSEHPLFTLGILLITGYGIGKAVVKIHLPEITGYILAGLLLGESVFKVVPYEMHDSLVFITDLALGLIALTMGGEFFSAKLKRMGRDVVVITLFQMVPTFIVITLAVFLMGIPLPFAFLLGTIAMASDPASTGAKVQTLRARGRFVDYLYGVIALDDALTVAGFGIVFAVVVGFLNPSAVGTSSLALNALREIFLSLLLGVVIGYIIHMMTRKKQSTNEILIIALGVLFIETAVAIIFELSPLLSNMAAGAFLINASPRNHRIFRILEPLTPPIYALFFVIAGTELNPAILLQREVLLIGVVFVVLRGIVKYVGVRAGAVACKAGDTIEKYLGLCMVPQAGIAIGLVLLIQASPVMGDLALVYSDQIQMLVNIILLSVFINELIGPSLSKFAIMRALEEE